MTTMTIVTIDHHAGDTEILGVFTNEEDAVLALKDHKTPDHVNLTTMPIGRITDEGTSMTLTEGLKWLGLR